MRNLVFKKWLKIPYWEVEGNFIEESDDSGNSRLEVRTTLIDVSDTIFSFYTVRKH